MISAIARLRAKKGFTLVEIIVVIAIIGVLAAMVLPAVTYDNRPSTGKGIAKDLFYAAQDAMASVKTAFPKAIEGADTKYIDILSSIKTITFFARIDDNGKISVDSAGKKHFGITINSIIPSSGGNTTATILESNVFADNITVAHDHTKEDDFKGLQKKVKDMFENDLTVSNGMAGTLYFVVDQYFRVTGAYWTDIGGTRKSDGSFTEFNNTKIDLTDECILPEGNYCCAFPVKLCRAGAEMFKTF